MIFECIMLGAILAAGSVIGTVLGILLGSAITAIWSKS